MRRTKIVGTLGPSSHEPAVLDALIAAGLDVARLNFSHGTHEFHRQSAQLIREAADRAGRPVAVLMDLQGPKIRVGRLPGGSVQLTAGEELTLDCAPGATAAPGRVPCDHAGLPGDVHVGDPVLLDDGRMRLVVSWVGRSDVRCRVIEGGLLLERKGVNLPGSAVSLPSLTAKDELDLKFGVEELNVDFVALSFVRSAEDVFAARRLSGDKVPVIAKIEKPQAVQNAEGIILAGAGIMVARGDLGVEYPLRKVPLLQKDLITRANHHGRLVIVATQMLESMIERPVPTRAEVSDVANAVLDGADAVMLSAETASGKYAVPAVRTMAEILEEVDTSPRFLALPEAALARESSTVTTAVARAAAAAARQLGLAAIAVYTRSGELARMVSDYRPLSRIIAYTPRPEVYRRMAALWGVEPRLAPEPFRTTDFMVAHVTKDLLDRGVARQGDTVAIVGPTPPDRPGFGASMMQVAPL